MSKVNNELRTLLILAQNQKSGKLVSISEIAEELGVSHRQARRYIEDIRDTNELFVDTKQGRNGGYYLTKELKDLLLPENIGVVMALAFRSNESIEKMVFNLSDKMTFDYIDGDSCFRDKKMLDNIAILVEAMKVNKTVTFDYDGKNNTYLVMPYKIIVTNGTCYLKGVVKKYITPFDIHKMRNIEIKDPFVPDESIKESINKDLDCYGIMDGKGSELRVKCDEEDVPIFQKYFENKGSYDKETEIYSVKAKNEHELYYPLFRISTKKYTFIDDSFKQGYIHYLENQIRSIKRNG